MSDHYKYGQRAGFVFEVIVKGTLIGLIVLIIMKYLGLGF